MSFSGGRWPAYPLHRCTEKPEKRREFEPQNQTAELTGFEFRILRTRYCAPALPFVRCGDGHFEHFKVDPETRRGAHAVRLNQLALASLNFDFVFDLSDGIPQRYASRDHIVGQLSRRYIYGLRTCSAGSRSDDE